MGRTEHAKPKINVRAPWVKKRIGVHKVVFQPEDPLNLHVVDRSTTTRREEGVDGRGRGEKSGRGNRLGDGGAHTSF